MTLDLHAWHVVGVRVQAVLTMLHRATGITVRITDSATMQNSEQTQTIGPVAESLAERLRTFAVSDGLSATEYQDRGVSLQLTSCYAADPGAPASEWVCY